MNWPVRHCEFIINYMKLRAYIAICIYMGIGLYFFVLFLLRGDRERAGLDRFLAINRFVTGIRSV